MNSKRPATPTLADAVRTAAQIAAAAAAQTEDVARAYHAHMRSQLRLVQWLTGASVAAMAVSLLAVVAVVAFAVTGGR